MKCKIHTEGFFINRMDVFGITMDIYKDSYVILDGGIIINSFNGVYQYPEVHSLGKWLVVPPQCGTYSGPAAGLDGIYGVNQRISRVWDIETSLMDDGSLITASQYQWLRNRADLPSLGRPFDPMPYRDPFEEDESFEEIELE